MIKISILIFVSAVLQIQVEAQSCNGKDFSSSKTTNLSFESFKTNCLNDVGPFVTNDGPLAWDSFSSSIGYPTYLNSCASPGTYHPLDNFHGSQAPLNGNGTVELRAGPCVGFCELEDPGEQYNYLKQQLPTPLLKGITYYIEFYVSLADISHYGVNSLGMYLTNNTNDLIPLSGANNLSNLTPQIPNTFPATTAYLNYTGWTKICGFFTPSVDGVRYIAIGNFRGSSNYTASSSLGYNAKLENVPYYYIDDVYIGEYSCCQEEQLYQNTSSLPSKTSVNNIIIAGDNILPQAVGDVVVSSGQNVAFKAGNSVTLKPGFRALSGSVFSATIGPCEKGIDDNQLNATIITQDLGTQIRLTATVSNGSGSYVYNWSTGASSSSIVVPYGFNLYTVVVTDLVQDNGYPSPCNIKVGWAQYYDSCPICRRREANSEESEVGEDFTQEKEFGEILVYPIPTNEKLRINSKIAIRSYSLYNMIGQASVVETFQIDNINEAEINVKDLDRGYYILSVLTIENSLVTRKILIK